MSPFSDIPGFASKTLVYKTTADGDIKVDVAYPEAPSSKPRTVLLHYHGGFLIIGDRYAFFPHWMVNACAARDWIFVTPDYRLMPEATAHAAVDDAADAYQWVLSTLPKVLGQAIGPILIAGSSAGGYLALSTASHAAQKPAGLLLMYGMLDATHPRYTTAGPNTFHRPPVETKDVLATFPLEAVGHRPTISENPVDMADAASAEPKDPRAVFIAALHLRGLFVDYFTGEPGLGARVASDGASAIPDKHRRLFPLDFSDLSKLPPTVLVHGQVDSAVPVACSLRAAEKLQAAGVEVLLETPDASEHGFDTRPGDVDVEAEDAGDKVPEYLVLRKAVSFLAESAKKSA